MSEQRTKAAHYLLVPRIVLEVDFGLDFPVADLNGTKTTHGLRGVNGLAGFSAKGKICTHLLLNITSHTEI